VRPETPANSPILSRALPASGKFPDAFERPPSRFRSLAAADALAHRIGKKTPPEGDVSILFFTDKQYGLTRNFSGRALKETEEKPSQFTLF
jgi:CRISPR-associated protein Cas2